MKYGVRDLMVLMMALLFVLVFPAHPVYAQDRMVKLKAVFLYKILTYVIWSQEIANRPVICTYPNDPFHGLLENINKTQSQPYEIKHIKRGQNIGACHAVFFTMNSPISTKFSGLSISDQEAFAEQGGMIQMNMIAEKIKLTINMGKMDEVGLKVSSRLLALAQVIGRD